MWHPILHVGIDMLGINSPPTQENFSKKIFPFDKYSLTILAFRKTLPRIHKTANQVIDKAYLPSIQHGYLYLHVLIGCRP